MAELLRAVIRKPPEQCFAAFCQVRRLRTWVPNLVRAKPLRTNDDGLATAVRFELPTMSYALSYSYDLPRRLVAWSPAGERDAALAVRGFATFEAHPDGCEMLYSLELGPGRDAELDNARVAVAAFARLMEKGR